MSRSSKVPTIEWSTATIRDGQFWPHWSEGTKVLIGRNPDRLQSGAAFFVFDRQHFGQVAANLRSQALSVGRVHPDQETAQALFTPFWARYRAARAGKPALPSSREPENRPKSAKNSTKPAPRAEKVQKTSKKSTRGPKTGVNSRRGAVGRSLGDKPPAKTTARPARAPEVTNSIGTTMNTQRNSTTTSGKPIVRQLVKFGKGDKRVEQIVRFVKGQKTMTVTSRGLPKITISRRGDEFIVKCGKEIVGMAPTPERGYKEALKSSRAWSH